MLLRNFTRPNVERKTAPFMGNFALDVVSWFFQGANITIWKTCIVIFRVECSKKHDLHDMWSTGHCLRLCYSIAVMAQSSSHCRPRFHGTFYLVSILLQATNLFTRLQLSQSQMIRGILWLISDCNQEVLSWHHIAHKPQINSTDKCTGDCDPKFCLSGPELSTIHQMHWIPIAISSIFIQDSKYYLSPCSDPFPIPIVVQICNGAMP